MTARTKYTTAFFAFSLLASTSITPAQAAVHTAETNWAINKVVSASSGSYCTMAQRYDDDTVVTVARNQSGEYSLAFDFIKPYFPGAKPTTVSVQPGGATSQSFEVIPQSDKIVVIGIGSNDSFINAMKGATKLDFQVSGQTHTFNTQKFASAAEELKTCAASMQAPASSPLAPQQVAQAAPPVQKTAPVSLQAAAVEPAASASVSQANDLPVPTGTIVAAMVSQPAASSAPVPAAIPAPAQAGKTTAALEAENALLKQALAQARQDLERAQTTSNASAASTAELNKAKADLAAAAASNQSLQAQLATVNQSVTQLQAQTAQASTVAEQMAALQKQNADMKTQLEASNRNLAQLQTQSAQTPALTSQIATLQKQNADMKAQLDTSNSTVAQLQTKSAQAEGAASQMAALQKQASDMKSQLDAANQTVAQLQTKAVQTASSADQLAVLQKQNTDMKAQLDAATQNVAQLQSRLAAAPIAVDNSKEISQLQNQVAGLKQQLSSAQSQPPATASASDLNDLRSQLQTARNENQGLKQQMEQLQSGVDQKLSAASANNWDLEQATKRYQESQREIRRLGALVQSQQKEFKKEKDAVEAQLFDPAITEQAQQAKLDALQSRIAELESGQAAGMTPAAGADLSEGSKAPSTEPVVQAASVTPVQAMDTSSTDKATIAELQLQLQQERAARARAVQMEPVQAQPTLRQQIKQAQAEQIANVAPAAGVETPEASAKPALVPGGAFEKTTKVPMPTRAVVAPVAQVSFQSAEDFNRILKQAGLNLNGNVETMPSTTTADYRAYRWKTENLFGSVEQRAMKGGNNFDTAVQQYLDRAESRCNGDFAAIPADVSVAADKSKAFEIACMGGKVNSTASVLFTYGNDVMMTIAHEGKSDAMDTAMEARDRVAGQLGSLKTASR